MTFLPFQLRFRKKFRSGQVGPLALEVVIWHRAFCSLEQNPASLGKRFWGPFKGPVAGGLSVEFPRPTIFLGRVSYDFMLSHWLPGVHQPHAHRHTQAPPCAHACAHTGPGPRLGMQPWVDDFSFSHPTSQSGSQRCPVCSVWTKESLYAIVPMLDLGPFPKGNSFAIEINGTCFFALCHFSYRHVIGKLFWIVGDPCPLTEGTKRHACHHQTLGDRVTKGTSNHPGSSF